MKKRAYLAMALIVAMTSLTACDIAQEGTSNSAQNTAKDEQTGTDENAKSGELTEINYDEIAFEDITPMPSTVEEFEALPNAPKLSTVATAILSDAVVLLNENSPEQAVATVVAGYEETGDESLLFYADEMSLRVYVKKETTTYQDGEVVVTEFDERGNVISYEGYGSKYMNSYDEDGHILTAKTLDGDEVVVSEEYEYDSHGNLVKSTVIEYGVESVSEYEYDENHNMLYMKLSTDGKVTSTEEFTYFNEDNYCDKMGYYKTYVRKEYEEGSLTGEYSSELDEHGNEVKSISKTKNYNEESTYEYEYDKDGNTLSMCEKTNGKTSVVMTYEYDKNGKIVKQDASVGEGDEKTVRHYEYKYDENGNEIEYKATVDDSEATGGFDQWYKKEYTKDQKLSKYTELGWDGSVVYESRFTYEDDGSYKESEMGYDGEGNVTYESTNYYNRKGALTVSETSHSRGEYVYDAMGNILSYKDDSYGYQSILEYGVIK